MGSFLSAKYLRILLIPLAISITAMMHKNLRNTLEDPDPDVQRELESFQLAEGFEVSLFAAEPLVVKPIQMNWDEDGRLWVVSSTAYPHLKTGEEANDKVYVLEDTDGDGKADKSTIFAEGLLTPTGILPGDGGVYVANSTEIVHFKDTDGDGKADQKRRILTGFGVADTHHLIHTFRWGPDGRMYFNQSIYIYSHVETPTGTRRLEGGGVWRLEPATLDLQVYARGLINPWGLEFDRWGQSFLTDGAGGEGINYAFPGATFVTSPGAERILRGLNPGQPKQSGLALVSDRHLPQSWQGNLLTNDFRANRINRFVLKEQGSGYVSRQMDDLLWTDHVAFRPVDISIGPDGAIYVADWYNPIIQHGEVDFHDPRRDQQHGRIWRIKAKGKPLVQAPRLSKASVDELLNCLKLPEAWTRGQARQLLKNRGASEVIPKLKVWLEKLDANHPDYEQQRLEALWVFQSLQVAEEPLLSALLQARTPQVRAAALRVWQDWADMLGLTTDRLANAIQDAHPQVRLEAVIVLRKIKTAEAARLALAVLEQPMDEFLDFALWQTLREQEKAWAIQLKEDPAYFGSAKKTVYALKSARRSEAAKQLFALYRQGKIPQEYKQDVLQTLARRGDPADLSMLLTNLAAHPDKATLVAELSALEEAARQRKIKPDGELDRVATLIVHPDPAVATAAIRLTGHWGLQNQTGLLTEQAEKGAPAIQKAALDALALINKPATEQLLTQWAEASSTPDKRLMAIARLAPLNPDRSAELGAGMLQTLPAHEDMSALFKAFTSDPAAVRAFTSELQTRSIPAQRATEALYYIHQNVSPYFIRRNQRDMENLQTALEGKGGKRPQEKLEDQLSDQQIISLAQEISSTANAGNGEKIYRQTGCTSCHALGGAGGLIGPDLSSLGTSSPTETIIRSVLNPSFSIKEGFELQRVIKHDKTEQLGYLTGTSESEVRLRDASGQQIAIPKSQITVMERIPGSLMPAGLTAQLSKKEFMDLIGFLSKLGESGPYRIPTARFVRRWQAASESVSAAVVNQAVPSFLKNKPLAYFPVFSTVAGGLPLSELPHGESPYTLVKFEVEALSAGNMQLAFNTTTGIKAWVNQKSVSLAQPQSTIPVEKGPSVVTLAIDRTLFKESLLQVQLIDDESSSAQIRLPAGQ